MNTLKCAAALAAGWLSLASAFAQPAASPEAVAYLQQTMQTAHIPGLAYAVVKDGQVIAMGTEGLANLAWNAPVDRQTVFQTASCSKLYCALLMGRLFDAGKLRPDQTLGELLDSVPDFWKQISLRQLLAHQSGIGLDNFGAFARAKNTQEALSIAKKQAMAYEPGTQSAYMSADYWVLQALLEKRFGKPYYALLKTHVLDPLGMTHTFVNQNDDSGIRTHEVLPREAAVYAYQDGRYKVSDMQFGSTGYTAGGVYTSIEDFAKLAQVLDKGTFLKPATQALLLQPTPLKNGQPALFGIGFINDTFRGYSLSGHSGGPALADFRRFNDHNITVLVLTNQRGVHPTLAIGLANFYVPGLKTATSTEPQRW